MMIDIRIVATLISLFSLEHDLGRTELFFLINRYINRLERIRIMKGMRLSIMEANVEALHMMSNIKGTI